MSLIDSYVCREKISREECMANHGFALALAFCILFWATIGYIVF